MEGEEGDGGDATLNEEELRERLVLFCDQLEQVEAALQANPGDADLLQAKADLTEVFQLTKDLLDSLTNNNQQVYSRYRFPFYQYGSFYLARNSLHYAIIC